MRTWTFTPLLLAVLAINGGCTKDEDTSETGETGDADTDTDSDTDTDTQVEYESFTGDVTFTRTYDDITQCDIDLSLVSTAAYTGDCASCDFGFKVDATVVTDNNTADCEKDFAYALLTFQDTTLDNNDANGVISEPWIGFSTEASVYYGYILYADSLVVGGTYNSDDYTDYPLMFYIPTEYTYYGYYGTEGPTATGSTSSFDGTDLTFEVVLEEQDSEDLLVGDCDNEFGADGAAVVTGGTTLDGELSCTDNGKVDVYTLTVAENDVISVSVDTTDASKIGDSFLTIIDSAGCFVAENDDAAFDCTVQPTDADSSDVYDLCSAWTGTAPAAGAGTYKIVVGSLYSCYETSQATWTYQLSVSGGSGLALETADFERYASHTMTTTAVGTGTAVAAE